MNRIDVVRAALAAVDGRSYLEIGVKDGACFRCVEAETMVAVDPRFQMRRPFRTWARKMIRVKTGSFYFQMTSDAFFAGPARRFGVFDVVFVDGLHTYAQAYVDVLNALDVLSDRGVVVVHDCNPGSTAAAAPTLEEAARTPGFSGEWNGDVYRALVRLRTHDDLRACVIDCDQGVGIVARGQPASRLDLSLDDIGGIAYADLAAERVALLDLRPESTLEAVLGGFAPNNRTVTGD